MTKDIIDRLTEYEAPALDRDDGERNAMGIVKTRGMVVPRRASCVEEIEEREAAYLAQPHFPLPFWNGDDGTLEPLTTDDFKLLDAAGITAEQWEIAVIEDHLERKKP